MTLGDIIRNYRETNNITLGEFANACSLSKGYISMLENNINPRNNKPISPTLPSMAKVASGMGIDLDVLLKMLDKKQPVQLVSDKTESSMPAFTIDYKTPDTDREFQQRIALYAKFLGLYDQLSSSNKEKVVSYTKGLLSTQQMEEDVLAAHARTDVEQTPEGVQHDLDIMDDDSMWDQIVFDRIRRYFDNIIYLPGQLGGCGTTPFLSLAERSGAYEYI